MAGIGNTEGKTFGNALENVNYSSYCDNCGASLEPNQRFCDKCGKNLDDFSTCLNCGYNLKSNSKYCPKCGKERK